jgi:Flp pilus assembly protein TadD
VLEGPLQEVITAADALSRRPPVPERALYVSATLAFACRRVAQGLRQPGDLPVALTLLDLALSQQPADAEAHVQRGLVLKRLQRLPEAEAAYRRALELGGDTVELHNNLGNLLLAAGRAAEAIPAFERALALEPGNATVRENLERARAGSAAPPP